MCASMQTPPPSPTLMKFVFAVLGKTWVAYGRSQLTSGTHFWKSSYLNPWKAKLSNEFFVVYPIHFQFPTIWYFLIISETLIANCRIWNASEEAKATKERYCSTWTQKWDAKMQWQSIPIKCVWIDFVSLSEMKTNEQSKTEIITMQAEGKKSRNWNIE